MSVETDRTTLEVLYGGGGALGPAGRAALGRLVAALRKLPDAQAAAVVDLIEGLSSDDYLSRIRRCEVPVLKVMAEILNGWDEDGVREFGGAWVSTLIAREDGFDWERGSLDQRQRHRERVQREIARRGL